MGDQADRWPARADYQNAVLDAKRTIKDRRLHSLHIEMMRLGSIEVPRARGGNFGSVYKFLGAEGTAFALKVFDRPQGDRWRRYHLIAQHLTGNPASPPLLSFNYEEQGILVNGRWWPTLVMNWGDGQPLDDYLKQTVLRDGQIDNNQWCRTWIQVISILEKKRIAHGDLQHGNILVAPNETFMLVDYDGMFVPEMRQAAMKAAEFGLPAYQHPRRRISDFDERIDDFPSLVILLTLASIDAQSWEKYHKNDNSLLFQKADFENAEDSALLNQLRRSTNRGVKMLAAVVAAASQGSIDAVPRFSEVIADKRIKLLVEQSPRQRRAPKPILPLRRQPTELSQLQREILARLKLDTNDRDIMHTLNISGEILRKELFNLQILLGTFSRAALIEWARGHGIREIDPPRSTATPTRKQILVWFLIVIGAIIVASILWSLILP